MDIVVNTGRFTADDAMAVAILLIATEGDMTIIRTDDTSIRQGRALEYWKDYGKTAIENIMHDYTDKVFDGIKESLERNVGSDRLQTLCRELLADEPPFYQTMMDEMFSDAVRYAISELIQKMRSLHSH